jgi:methylase of polypeptide subunit release factors
MAIDGGRSGLDCILRLLEQVKERINFGGCLLLEIGQNQEEDMGQLVRSCINEANSRFIADFNGIKRVVKIELGCPI